MLEVIGIFVLMTLTDFVWAISIRAISHDKAIVGSLTAAMLVFLNGIATISYVHKPLLIIPAAMGAFFGVYLSSKLKKNNGK